MNRDEQHIRARSFPPALFGSAVYPHEPGTHGTWIAVNSSGLTLALLNKNESGPLPAKLRSRGELIPALISAESLADVHRCLVEVGFKGMLPFRLVAISPNERELCEWSRGTELRKTHNDWQPRHWFSSGMSDFEATRIRSSVVDQAWQDPEAGSLPWLRALHRSHEPRRGAYSICVHRDDASTVSYSEITYENGSATFRYTPGSPCQHTAFETEQSLPTKAAAKI